MRYADDCIIFANSQRAAERIIESITRFIENDLKLKVNPDKSKIIRPQECKHLDSDSSTWKQSRSNHS